MVDGAAVHTPLLRLVEEEGIGGVIRTHRLRAQEVVVVGEEVTLQEGTVISSERVSLRGGPLEGIRHRIGVGVVVEEEDGLHRIHDLEAHQGVELHVMIDVAVFLEVYTLP